MTIFELKLREKATASVSDYTAACLTTEQGNVEDPWDDGLYENSSQL